MKLVTFNGTMAPHGDGDTRLVPDDVARDLEKQGALSATETWPPTSSAPAPSKPVRPTLKPARPIGTPDKRKAE